MMNLWGGGREERVNPLTWNHEYIYEKKNIVHFITEEQKDNKKNKCERYLKHL